MYKYFFYVYWFIFIFSFSYFSSLHSEGIWVRLQITSSHETREGFIDFSKDEHCVRTNFCYSKCYTFPISFTLLVPLTCRITQYTCPSTCACSSIVSHENSTGNSWNRYISTLYIYRSIENSLDGFMAVITIKCQNITVSANSLFNFRCSEKNIVDPRRF